VYLCVGKYVCVCAVQEQHDLLCVLLMIQLNAEHRALMVQRRVPCLDDYLDRVNLLLWPRFKVCQGGCLRQVYSCCFCPGCRHHQRVCLCSA